MRRRLRRQRRVREALLLDLGALVYELHRQGKRAPDLLQEKAGELTMVDEEVRGLEEALGDGAGLDGLMGTGIMGSCASCGALLNAGDAYCAHCGAPAQVRTADTAEWGADADTGEFEAGEAESGGEGAGQRGEASNGGDEEPDDAGTGETEPVAEAESGEEELDDEGSRA
jgi:hypothetical protein